MLDTLFKKVQNILSDIYMSSRRLHYRRRNDDCDSHVFSIIDRCRSGMKYNTRSRIDNGGSAHFQIFNDPVS